MADLHLQMPAWSEQGERMLVSFESTDRVGSNTLGVDCSGEEVQNTRGVTVSSLAQKNCKRAIEDGSTKRRTEGGFEAWHSIVSGYGQRNTSDKELRMCSNDQRHQ